jgi:hypothetical protein
MGPTSLAAYGFDWYISDTLTRDEKQHWQLRMDDEFNRSIELQDETKRPKGTRPLSRSGRLNKSAYDELLDYYRDLVS